MLNFSSAFSLNNYVSPISIPSASFGMTSGQNVELCGWGTLYSGGPLPSILQNRMCDKIDGSELWFIGSFLDNKSQIIQHQARKISVIIRYNL